MADDRRTLAERIAHVDLMIELEKHEAEMREIALRRAVIPPEWAKLPETAPVRPRRKKVTVALDEDVARWFRSLGEGYHRRINAVLRTYMLAVVAKVVKGKGG